MKIDALDHPKTLDFSARLAVSRPTAIGHLELLWAFTGKQAPQGNVGKWPDGSIARACDWMGSPGVFIRALIESGFLDCDPDHRLIVHDWPDHASGWVRAKLKKMGLNFATSDRSSEPSSDGSSEASIEATEVRYEPSSVEAISTSEPSPRAPVSKPSLAKTNQDKRKTRAREPVPREAARPPDPDPTPEPSASDADARDEITRLRAQYPPGAAREDWITAEHHARRTVEAGTPWEALHAGVERYAAHVKATGRLVLNPARFFGDPDKPWSQAWPIPKTRAERAQDANVEASLQWLREQGVTT